MADVPPVAGEVQRQALRVRATCAIVATESRLGLVDNLPSLQLWLRARAQWHGIHVRQKKEPVRISECALPGRSTMRLPVSVGTGMRVFASSKRIERVGTPASRRAAKSSLPMLASRPVMPSTARKRIRRAIATSVSIVDMAMAPQHCGQHWTNPHSRQQMFALVRIVRHSCSNRQCAPRGAKIRLTPPPLCPSMPRWWRTASPPPRAFPDA